MQTRAENTATFRILHVEDNETVAEHVKETLETKAGKLIAARMEMRALRRLAEVSADYDLCLLITIFRA